LRAVRFVGDHHDVLAGAQLVVHVALFGLEFLDGGEHHAAAGHLQQLLQVVAVLGLHGFLPQQLHTGREGVEELVVQVVAVGDDDDGGVVQRQHHLAGVEHHAQALAAALRVPHHTALPVAAGLLAYADYAVALGRFGCHR
jgi:hypothetical protein